MIKTINELINFLEGHRQAKNLSSLSAEDIEDFKNHAETLHKQLGLHSETATPKQVEEDLLIVDEVSMMEE